MKALSQKVFLMPSCPVPIAAWMACVRIAVWESLGGGEAKREPIHGQPSWRRARAVQERDSVVLMSVLFLATFFSPYFELIERAR
ncbi:hypothetical protein Q8A67_004047 [Cirrhinus molitorella]|uniref:Uncharacterized protein n=1 Tax=Cirrhinus molitorella TaxID=172907 RepID=A0AA88Q487_9TELE|nr:hypothetical protein Q8A67_004047 [Cirrhinus molitorella]